MSRQRGFTLIEMAMVLIIMGLLVSGGVMAVGPLVENARRNQTNTALDQAEAALVLFVMRNNRLPCPADGSLKNTVAGYGLEVTQTGNGGVVGDQTSNNCPFVSADGTSAVLPWRTLGLDETYSVDGWGGRLAYFPAVPKLGGVATDLGSGVVWSTLVDNPPAAGLAAVNCMNRVSTVTGPSPATPPPQGTRSLAACDPVSNASMAAATTGNSIYGNYNVPTYPFGAYIPVTSINSAGGLGNELTTADANVAGAGITGTTVSGNGLRAAYVLISHGKSGWYGWDRNGLLHPPPNGTTYTLKLRNSGTIANLVNGGFVQGTPVNSNDRTSATYFDDIVRWRSPSFIIQQCGAAACGNP